MEKLGKLPPCPKLCRGGECNGIPSEEEEPGFPYSHINNMVISHDKTHMSMDTRDGCYLFHLWPARKRPNKPALALVKNSGKEPRAQGTSPRATAATSERLGNRGMPTALGTGPSGSSSSASSSLEGSSSSSSSNKTASPTREQ
jgi:hypothetical protein